MCLLLPVYIPKLLKGKWVSRILPMCYTVMLIVISSVWAGQSFCFGKEDNTLVWSFGKSLACKCKEYDMICAGITLYIAWVKYGSHWSDHLYCVNICYIKIQKCWGIIRLQLEVPVCNVYDHILLATWQFPLVGRNVADLPYVL